MSTVTKMEEGPFFKMVRNGIVIQLNLLSVLIARFGLRFMATQNEGMRKWIRLFDVLGNMANMGEKMKIAHYPAPVPS